MHLAKKSPSRVLLQPTKKARLCVSCKIIDFGYNYLAVIIAGTLYILAFWRFNQWMYFSIEPPGTLDSQVLKMKVNRIQLSTPQTPSVLIINHKAYWLDHRLVPQKYTTLKTLILPSSFEAFAYIPGREIQAGKAQARIYSQGSPGKYTQAGKTQARIYRQVSTGKYTQAEKTQARIYRQGKPRQQYTGAESQTKICVTRHKILGRTYMQREIKYTSL